MENLAWYDKWKATETEHDSCIDPYDAADVRYNESLDHDMRKRKAENRRLYEENLENERNERSN